MKNKTVLIEVKNEEALNNYKRMLQQKEYDNVMPYSREVRVMIEEFTNNKWDVYLATISNLNSKNGIYQQIYNVKEEKFVTMTIEELNSKISAIIIRNIGSVELNFNMIQEFLEYLTENYKGLVLNNPKAMLRGMTKKYLVEIDPEELKEYSMSVIPTKIFPKEVTYDKIHEEYPTNKENYLIKPITGELSNSLKCLAEIDEEFLRWKETKVGGWVIQPIQQEIWDGEYQISFLNGEVIYAQEKKYPKEGEKVPNQKNRTIVKYYPEEMEINNIKKVIQYFSKLYQIEIDICRIDFMKKEDGTPILLEFEMVNPGFFIGYMKENDLDIKKITKSICLYCEEKIEK